MAPPDTRTIDTLRRIDVAFPRHRQAGQRPEIRATCLLFPSGPLGEWHPAIPSREPLQEISPYIRAIAGSKIFPYHPAGCTKHVSESCGLSSEVSLPSSAPPQRRFSVLPAFALLRLQ